jgi:hypothetical protein
LSICCIQLCLVFCLCLSTVGTFHTDRLICKPTRSMWLLINRHDLVKGVRPSCMLSQYVELLISICYGVFRIYCYFNAKNADFFWIHPCFHTPFFSRVWYASHLVFVGMSMLTRSFATDTSIRSSYFIYKFFWGRISNMCRSDTCDCNLVIGIAIWCLSRVEYCQCYQSNPSMLVVISCDFELDNDHIYILIKYI